MNLSDQCFGSWKIYTAGFESASYLFFALLALFFFFNLLSRYGNRLPEVPVRLPQTLEDLERRKKFLEIAISRRKKSLETSESK